MILENNLAAYGFGYALVLLAADHTDAMELSDAGAVGYVRISPLWGYETSSVHESLSPEVNQLGRAFDLLFPNLAERMWAGHVNDNYNETDEMYHHHLWVVQGSAEDLATIWRNLFNHVKTGPEGGDDDTFDYWPSAWGVMLHFAEDLIQLGALQPAVWKEVQAAWDVIAVHAYPGTAEGFAEEVVSRPVSYTAATN